MLNILVQNNHLKQKAKKIFVPTALALLLSACTTSGLFTNPVTESLKNEAYGSSEYYVNKVLSAKDDENKQSYRLLATRQLLAENKVDEAQDMFSEISKELTEEQQVEYKLVSGELSAMKNKNTSAVMALKGLPMKTLSNSQMRRYYKTLVQVAENKSDELGAVRARISMDKYLTEANDHQANSDRIWKLLRSTNKGSLQNVGVTANETALGGWISLINTYNQNISRPNSLPSAISQWKARYPTHMATKYTPAEVKDLANFQATAVNQTALLLPLTGDAGFLGDIVKKGFDDARGVDDQGVTVDVLDTGAQEVSELILQARNNGDQMIVGPLLKDNVNQAVTQSNITGLNVLTLNSVSGSNSRAKVCYFGLTPESEAISGADKIKRDGFNSVVVVVPKDDFGQRSANAFVQRWRALTGGDADVRYYTEAMDVVNNLQEAGGMQGKALYFLGSAEQLLEAKESIDGSEFANQVAIYTSSRSHSPNADETFNETMSGVKFSEIPLLADNTSEAYQRASELAEGDFSMMRLYAMGADAWTLMNNFNELRQVPGYAISGLTGRLTAGSGCHINRKLSWLEYNYGGVVSAE